jgi:hypothetical protein
VDKRVKEETQKALKALNLQPTIDDVSVEKTVPQAVYQLCQPNDSAACPPVPALKKGMLSPVLTLSIVSPL